MYEELKEKFNSNEVTEIIVTENNTVLMEYFEDVLKESDELVNEVFNLFAKYSSTTDEEFKNIRRKYEKIFETNKWSFVEVSWIGNEETEEK